MNEKLKTVLIWAGSLAVVSLFLWTAWCLIPTERSQYSTPPDRGPNTSLYDAGTTLAPGDIHNTSYPQEPPVEVRLVHSDLRHTVPVNSTGPLVDTYPLQGDGTYHIVVKTYEPGTTVRVLIGYQELIDKDKFGTKTYGGMGEGSHCLVLRGSQEPVCSSPRTPGAMSTYLVKVVDRFSDLNTTVAVPSTRLMATSPYYIDDLYVPSDIINVTLRVETTAATEGRITVDVWKIIPGK